MREHERFAILCALAVSGQLTDSELSELRSHTAQCIDCRCRLQDMARVSVQMLLPVGAGKANISAEMEERFMLRARAEGVPLQRMRIRSPEKSRTLYREGALAAAILLAVLAAAFFFKTPVRAPIAAVVVSPKPSPVNMMRLDAERNERAIKTLYKNRRRVTAALFPISKSAMQITDAHALEVSIRQKGFPADASSLPGAQGEIREFHYDPLAGDVPRQIAFLRLHVDWYRVWTEAQENPKRLEISFQPEWKAGMVP